MHTLSIVPASFRLSRPSSQNFVMGLALFCLPGIYLALTGLGAGGGRPSSQEVASLTNAILYGVYTVFGWCGGSVLNLLGPRNTAVIGGMAYPFYVGSLWYYDRSGNDAFPLISGALLGVGAALFWTTSGFIQFAYAEEKDKAKYITVQWVLSAAGSAVGAVIAFSANFRSEEAVGVSSAVYITFIVVMCVAIGMSFFLLIKPQDVVRDDGRRIAIFEETTVLNELKGILSVMTDRKIVILLPSMFTGEICLALVSSINAHYFNLRTRSLTNLLFQVVMIPAPIAFAYIMDTRRISSRRARGLLGVSVIGIISIGAIAGLLAWIIKNDVDDLVAGAPVDWTDKAFASAFILYLLFGVVYACFQITVQWTLASLTNEPSLCARYAGAFKGTVSLGMCLSFVVDAQGMSYRNQAIMQLVLYALGVVCLAYVVSVYVKETNYGHEPMVIVPETVDCALQAKMEIQQVEDIRHID